MADKTRNPTGWGYLEDVLSASERKALVPMAGALFGGKLPEARPAPAAEAIALPASRLQVPGALQGSVSTAQADRLLHARGRSFPDLVDLRQPELAHVPDAVAEPADEAALMAVLDWCDSKGYAVIPFGGGSSVVGGVTPEGVGAEGIVTLSLQQLRKVHDIDARAATVHADAGILGPELEAAVKHQGLAVRHFPQSYFHSSLGGWVATRGAGHFSTQHAKIEDRVQALRVVLPDGRIAETKRLPAGSVGVDPNRLWCGSEGTLGVITQVWLRCMLAPSLRDGCGIAFKRFEDALEAARAMLQCGLYPTQLRILDPYEHMVSRMMAGRPAQGALMVLAFESAGAPVGPQMAAAREIAQQHGGSLQDSGSGEASTGDWKNTFFRQPYLRDALLDHAAILDTFETAVLWSQVPDAYHGIRDAVLAALEAECGGGAVTCRVTHAYADGCCLYFGFFGAGRHDSLKSQWQAIRDAAAAAVTRFGGTASHHHAMGRMHRGYARDELPEAFVDALHGARSRLDPHNIMNPGLLPDV